MKHLKITNMQFDFERALQTYQTGKDHSIGYALGIIHALQTLQNSPEMECLLQLVVHHMLALKVLTNEDKAKYEAEFSAFMKEG